MELLITYEDEAEAEAALELLAGEKRLVSDRDDNEVIYRLFGEPTWTNLFKLGLYDLPALKELLESRAKGETYDAERHQAILTSLRSVENCFGIEVPAHWR